MGGMEGVEVDVSRRPRRAADPGDDNDPVLIQVERVDRGKEGLQDYSVAAARAPYMREVVLPQVFEDVLWHP